jgi:hypothetical protein
MTMSRQELIASYTNPKLKGDLKQRMAQCEAAAKDASIQTRIRLALKRQAPTANEQETA